MPMLMPTEEDTEEEGEGEEDLPEGEEAAILVLDAEQE